MFSFMKPAPHIKSVSADEVDPLYQRLRWKIFAGIFFGYAGYYLLRKNFSLAMPFLIESGYSRSQLGYALGAVSLAYGLSKFVMGNLSDRSNARVFSHWVWCSRQSFLFYLDSPIGRWLVCRPLSS